MSSDEAKMRAAAHSRRGHSQNPAGAILAGDRSGRTGQKAGSKAVQKAGWCRRRDGAEGEGVQKARDGAEGGTMQKKGRCRRRDGAEGETMQKKGRYRRQGGVEGWCRKGGGKVRKRRRAAPICSVQSANHHTQNTEYRQET